jgi:hypothetical protein
MTQAGWVAAAQRRALPVNLALERTASVFQGPAQCVLECSHIIGLSVSSLKKAIYFVVLFE